MFENGRTAILRLSRLNGTLFALSLGPIGPLSQPLSPPGSGNEPQIEKDFIPDKDVTGTIIEGGDNRPASRGEVEALTRSFG